MGKILLDSMPAVKQNDRSRAFRDGRMTAIGSLFGNNFWSTMWRRSMH